MTTEYEYQGTLTWDGPGEKFYETGVNHGVLYPYNSGNTHPYGPGVAWNGLSSISESPSGADENAIYADNIKYLSLRGTEDFGATIEAYTYPDEWMACDGSAEVISGVPGVYAGQQPRKKFGLCYKTIVGNDEDLDNKGYKLHLIYGCTASPSDRQYSTVNDSPEPIAFSWELSTVPENVAGLKPTSILTIDTTKLPASAKSATGGLGLLEKALYGVPPTTPEGTDGVDPYLPLPAEVIAMFTEDDD